VSPSSFTVLKNATKYILFEESENGKTKVTYKKDSESNASDSSEIVYFPILRGFLLFDEMIFINSDRSSPCNKKQSALILGTVFNCRTI
jgi:hypothetical protein